MTTDVAAPVVDTDGALSATDQRHTQTVVGDHFSDIDEDEQEGEATSKKSFDVGVNDEAQATPYRWRVDHPWCV